MFCTESCEHLDYRQMQRTTSQMQQQQQQQHQHQQPPSPQQQCTQCNQQQLQQQLPQCHQQQQQLQVPLNFNFVPQQQQQPQIDRPHVGLCFVSEGPEGLSVDCNVPLPQSFNPDVYQKHFVSACHADPNSMFMPQRNSFCQSTMPLPSAQPISQSVHTACPHMLSRLSRLEPVHHQLQAPAPTVMPELNYMQHAPQAATDNYCAAYMAGHMSLPNADYQEAATTSCTRPAFGFVQQSPQSQQQQQPQEECPPRLNVPCYVSELRTEKANTEQVQPQVQLVLQLLPPMPTQSPNNFWSTILSTANCQRVCLPTAEVNNTATKIASTAAQTLSPSPSFTHTRPNCGPMPTGSGYQSQSSKVAAYMPRKKKMHFPQKNNSAQIESLLYNNNGKGNGNANANPYMKYGCANCCRCPRCSHCLWHQQQP